MTTNQSHRQAAKGERQYRIERRNESGTEYWLTTGDGRYSAWMFLPESATIFTEGQRRESLALHVAGKANGFPAGGIWVELSGEQPVECTADADHPCGSTNGQRCDRCKERDAYWERQWNATGRREVAHRTSIEDLRDCYSDPTEAAKLAGMLGEGKL